MNNLKEIIADEIQHAGMIPFSRFMELCLYHPTKGYYRKDFLPIGKSGDYFTSPCVHRIFGHILARQIKELLDLVPDDEIFLVEAGAGRGHLARDIGENLRALDSELHQKVRLLIIEPHLPFRDVQYSEVKDYYKKTEFIDTPDSLPDFSGVFYANELFDAFPVEILVRGEKDVGQMYVGFDGSGFIEINGRMTDEIERFLKDFNIVVPNNFRTEIAPSVVGFYQKIAAKLRKGACLTIDYGYSQSEYLNERHNRGTLMAYYGHSAAEDPYLRVGEQDLTAHLNFSILKKVGESEGLFTAGYAEQEQFLMGAGFIDEVERLKSQLSTAEYETEIKKIKTLVITGGMGSIFKMLCQTGGLQMRGYSGFKFRNSAAAL